MRLIYTSEKPRCMGNSEGKMFAVIGPFESFQDKPKLQKALQDLLLADELSPLNNEKSPP